MKGECVYVVTGILLQDVLYMSRTTRMGKVQNHSYILNPTQLKYVLDAFCCATVDDFNTRIVPTEVNVSVHVYGSHVESIRIMKVKLEKFKPEYKRFF